jgi:hypothetical protein
MLNFKKLHITYINPKNPDDQLTIDYRLRDTSITHKWVQRVLLAQQLGYPIDDPARFYGVGSLSEQEIGAVSDMNNLIQVLKNWINIDKRLSSVQDQDTLNYLHHIFETEHGLLDKQNYGTPLQQNLSKLNILVHRCESIARGARPRHVVTYFGLPKTEVLGIDDYQCFESKIKFGTVYINYAEIGKTLHDLMLDNDSYIKPEAVQPFVHYSADFVVKFWNDSQTNLKKDLYAYYAIHESFFKSIGYTWDKLSQSIGSIPVADIDYPTHSILECIESRQYVKAVDFS